MASREPLGLERQNRDVDTKQEFCNWLDEHAEKPIVIALAGRSGVGKSTLLNNILGLEGDMAATTGHDGNATTTSVTQYNCTTLGGKNVTIEVIDTPGLDSLDLSESVILLDLEEKSKGKADLLLYCASLQPSGKIGTTDKRIVETLTKAFGKQIWTRTVLVLTFANEVSKMQTSGVNYEKLLRNYAANFERCLKQSNVSVRVLPPDVTRNDLTMPDEIQAIPAGLDMSVPLPNIGDWMGALQKEILQKCNLDALPKLLLLSGRVKMSSVLQSVAGGAALGVVVGTGVGAAIGGALVGIPTLGVGAPLGIGAGSAAGALIGSVSSATIVSVIHNRVVPAIRKRAVIRKREKEYKRLESRAELEYSYYDMPSEIPVEEEKWFFGQLKRNLAEGKCKENGDYLVRYSDKQEKYVLTCRHDGRGKHFTIGEIVDEFDADAPKQFYFGPMKFQSIRQLLNYHVDTKTPLTVKSQVIISRPITRYGSIPFSNIEVGSKIGKGAFGDVYEAMLISANLKVAVKTCRSIEIQEREKFLQEAEISSKYDHPNVVRLLGLSEDLGKKHTYIVMEFMPGGSFLNFLKKKGFSQSKGKLCRMCIDACKGMEYLESMSCIHRDLSARNCLVGENYIVKISDFGMSREGGLYVVSVPRALPIKWTAPEALHKGQYTSASDVWSFGILLWEAFSCGTTPYPGMTNQETDTKIEIGYRMPSPVDCPQNVYGIMQQCWQYQPEERPDFAMLLEMLTQAEQNISRSEAATNRMVLSTRL